MGEPRIGLGPLGQGDLGREKFDLPPRPLFGRLTPKSRHQAAHYGFNSAANAVGNFAATY